MVGAGTVIAGKYRVTSVLGSGGMSCLVKADHLLMKKQVAIKFLRSDGRSRVGASRRLFREARAAQSLSSEHVVRVFDLGVHEDSPYIVMELLDGSDLAGRVANGGPLAIEDAVDVMLETCVAVAEAHAHGIYHRDLKPANLFAARRKTHEVIKVLDFGISKVPADEVEDCEKTSSDAMLGTPYYMSPEQLRNPSNVDGRTDVWALGVTLFFLLSGEHPFRGANRREVMAAVLTDPPRDLAELVPDLPAPLLEAIAGALEKRIDDRTPTIHALATALLPFASKRGARAGERVLAIGGSLPPKPEETFSPTTSDKMATTDDGLSSTLPPTEDIPPAATPSPPPAPSKRRFTIPGAIALVAIASMAVIWQSSKTTTTRAPTNLGSSSATPEIPLSAPPRSSIATPLSAPVVEPSVVATTQPAASGRKDPSTPRPIARPRQPSAAAPSQTASASKPSPRVDIDGVPIVE